MKYISIYILLVACIIACGCTMEKPTTHATTGMGMDVIFVDVEQGDAILILYNSTATLIDAGKTDYGATVIHTMREHGVSHLNYAIMTHEHEDHFGGFGAVFTEYEPDYIVYTSCSSDTCQKRMKDGNAQIIHPRAGTYLYVDPDVTMRVLSPPQVGFTDVNDNSIVILLSYGDASFLFMGDVEEGAEEYLLDTYTWELDVDVLKVGHHGSSGSITQEFLQVTTPEIAVISVGKNNQYDHPAESTLKLLSKIPIMRTDVDGTIVMETDGKEIRI